MMKIFTAVEYIKNWSYTAKGMKKIGQVGRGDQTITLAQDHPQWLFARQNTQNSIL